MGQLDNIQCDHSCDRFFHNLDIIGLVHTGIVDNDIGNIHVSTSHKCIYSRSRPLSPQSGGHAIFIRKNIDAEVNVVCDRIQYGVVWIKISNPKKQKGLHVAFVYLPPSASNYYTQVEGVSFDEHMKTLQQDIAMFQEKGQVIVMGDFNSRIGRLNEWDLLDPHIRRHYDTHGVKDRRSKDNVINNAGRRLISLCEGTGIYILNGRSGRDRHGSISFRSLGGMGKSVIDYAMVSRDLILSLGGEDLNFGVIPIHSCPTRHRGGRYDHSPIVVYVNWSIISNLHQQHNGNEVRHDRIRWRPEHRGLYTDIMQTDGVVLGYLDKVKREDVSTKDTCEYMTLAIMRAAEVLHSRVGGVFVTGKQKSGGHRERWLSAEARVLRRRLKEAERGMPNTASLVQELRSLYRKQVKKDRRVMIKSKRDKIRNEMTRDVKSFWRRFRSGRKAENQHSVEQWTGYFDELFNKDKLTWNDDEFQDHCLKYREIFGVPEEGHLLTGAALNSPIQDNEVEVALRAMGLGKAAGADGIPVEFFRQAYHERVFTGEDGKPRIVRDYVMTPSLISLFNKVFLFGQYPTDWAVGLVTPVPKPKGDLSDMDAYRAIAVGSAISKIFAQVMLARLDKWAEAHDWRAKTQFGFRKGRGTAEATFLLRHLIDKAQDARSPLYAAFIDFRKAYDSVPRELLWKCLHKMGIHGCMLETLQQIYSNIKLQVKVDQDLGPDFESNIGVKQGDPLSPLLFGLYIDRFATFLKDRIPEGDVLCGEEIIQVLLYADDLVLVTHDPTLLQKYLDVLTIFCEATKMMVNVSKSEIVVFFKQWAPRNLNWVFNDKRVKEVQEFTYLGVVLHSKGFKFSVSKAIKRRALKAKNALFSIFGSCQGQNVFDTPVLTKLFDGVVIPSALYGVEVWGVDVCEMGDERHIYMPLEETQILFMRMALMISKHTPHVAMMKELKRQFLFDICLKRCVGFWNKVCKRGMDCIIKKAMVESCSLVRCGWAWKFQNTLSRVVDVQVNYHLDSPLTHIDMKHVRQRLLARRDGDERSTYETIDIATHGCSGSAVRQCPNNISKGFKTFKYYKWFYDEDTKVIALLQDAFDIRILAKFRCGMHWLATEKDRSAGFGRSDRLCKCCTKQEREDELHIMFCEAYAALRNEFPHVFQSELFCRLKHAYDNNENDLDLHMNRFMNQNDSLFTNEFVGYLRRSITIRERLLT